jgi:hypothetical protein
MGPSRLDALRAAYTARRSTVRGATPGEVENLMPACREPFGSRNNAVLARDGTYSLAELRAAAVG